jgi:gas vesicle protein
MKTLKQMRRYSKYAVVGLGTGALMLAAFALAQNTGNVLVSPKSKNLASFSTTTAKQRLEAAEVRAKEAVQNLEKIRTQVQGEVKQVRAKVQEKIGEILNNQKQKSAEQIVSQLEHLNEVWTDHFADVLNHLDTVLQKIKTRADKAAANSLDVSGVNTAITTAETAISKARTAIETQAKKAYTVDLTAVQKDIATTTTAIGQNKLVTNLRAQFKTLRDQLMKDLFGLRDGLVKEARTTVQNAFQALSKVPDVNED